MTYTRLRLPTEAEWEYALKVKDSGEDSPYRNWWKSPQIGWNVVEVRKMCDGNGYDTSDYSDWQLLPVEVGRKPPNGLGLFDMLGNGSELVLDTFDPDSFVVKEDMMSAKNANQTGIVYADNDKDPLTYFEKCWARGLTRSGRWHCNPYRKAGTDPNVGHITVRLCIGPDLMKEKGHAFRHKNK